MKWFFPSWSGDFRLEKIDPKATYRDAPSVDVDTSCVLRIIEPTPGEVTLLERFLVVATKEGWTKTERVEVTKPSRDAMMRQDIVLAAPMELVGRRLLKFVRPKKATITALRFEDGKVITAQGTDDHAIEKVAEAITKADDAPPEKKPKAAASVSRPTPCCPVCEPGSIAPAREVLLSFLDPQQHQDWAEHRAIVVTGGLSGHRYLLMHRNSPGAAANTKMCFDLDDEATIHFHDNSVPPEEEVLAAKLVLEHAEDWLRNEATHFGGARGMRHRFRNPFGDYRDGMESASFTENFARGALQVMESLKK